MSVLKNSLRQKFAQIPNELITDTRLSNGAFRVAAYLYSRPDNWNVNNKDVQKSLGINDRGTLAKYWNELINYGWVARELKPHNEEGHFGGYDYTLLMSSTVAGKTLHGDVEPCREKPAAEKTRSGKNPTLNNKESFNNTDSLSNNESAHAPFSEKQEPQKLEVVANPKEPLLGGGQNSELPPDEQRIEDACERVYAYFKKYPALVQTCREQAKNPDLTKLQIKNEIQAWVRYHCTEFTFLAAIESQVSKSFLSWMRNYTQFLPKAAKQNFAQTAQPTPQVYVRPQKPIEKTLTPVEQMISEKLKRTA